MSRKLFALISIVLIAMLVLPACGSAATQAPVVQPTNTVEQPAVQPTEQPTVAAKVKVGLSFSDFATERWKNEATLMTKLLEAKGYTVVVQEAAHDVKLQNDQIDNMVSQGVKGLIVIAEDGDAAATAVDKAAKAGVKVIA
jgi:ABC-type xylose transport system substrate-binding protein